MSFQQAKNTQTSSPLVKISRYKQLFWYWSCYKNIKLLVTTTNKKSLCNLYV